MGGQGQGSVLIGVNVESRAIEKPISPDRFDG